MLGIPDRTRACLFDLDGVLTRTAVVHAAAWQEMFDQFLRQRAERSGDRFTPFDPAADYDTYVDGKPRDDGTRSFLASRGITLPDAQVHALGELKNRIVLRKIAADGVAAYPGSVRYVQAVAEAGLARAVVSSSTNCRDILAAAGIDGLFDTVVDGVLALRERLNGKPAPDTYLAAARALGVPPDQAAVFEDALAGVAAGRAGQFGWVVGVDRVGQAAELQQEGADVVVTDLAELLDTP